MLTNKDILRIAMEQSAADIGCKAEDFLSDKNVIVPLKLCPNAKRYYKLPIGANFISYGSNVVAAVTDEVKDIVSEYISKFEFFHCFETPNMHWLNERLSPLGMTTCFMAEYYLPDVNRLKELPCEYEMKVLEKGQFDDLYLPEWANALCSDRKHLFQPGNICFRCIQLFLHILHFQLALCLLLMKLLLHTPQFQVMLFLDFPQLLRICLLIPG